MFAAGMSLNHCSAVPDKAYLITASCSAALLNLLLCIPNQCLYLAKNSLISTDILYPEKLSSSRSANPITTMTTGGAAACCVMIQTIAN